MKEQAEGRGAEHVRARVIEILGSAFHPRLAAVIADTLVAPGMERQDKIQVLTVLSEAMRAEVWAMQAEVEAMQAENEAMRVGLEAREANLEASAQLRRRETDLRYELMVGLAAVVPATMGKLRSGRDVDQVQAEVVEFLSRAFEPEQAEAIANLLVAPGISEKDEVEVLRLVLWTTGFWDDGPELLEAAVEARIHPPDLLPEPGMQVHLDGFGNEGDSDEVQQLVIRALTEIVKAKTEILKAETELLKADAEEDSQCWQEDTDK